MHKILHKTVFLFALVFSYNTLIAQKPKASFQYVGYDCRVIMLYADTTFPASPYAVVSRKITFGDGSSQVITGPHVKHLYAKDSNFRVCLIAKFYDSTSSSYFSDTFCKVIKVKCSSHCIESTLDIAQDTGNCSIYHMFFRLGGHSDGVGKSTYEIDFGDGNKISGSNVVDTPWKSTNYALDNIHQYTPEKSYLIKFYSSQYDSIFKVTCFDTVIYLLKTKCCVRSVFKYVEDYNNCRKISIYDSYKSGVNVRYAFGDGDSSTSRSPSHTYTKDSTYTITAYVSFYNKATSKWCYDTSFSVVEIDCQTCKVRAQLWLDYDSTQPYKANLYNYSTGTITKHSWAFGDGATSNAKAPSHTYTSAGTYTLVYKAYDSIANCYDSTIIVFTIDSLGRIKRGNQTFTLQVIDKTQNSSSLKQAEKRKQVSVYPNPASRILHIETKSSESVKIEITDAKGARISGMTIETGSKMEIDVSMWAKGLYILNNSLGEHIKFVVE